MRNSAFWFPIILLLASFSLAQKRAEAGLFVDYLDVSQTSSSNRRNSWFDRSEARTRWWVSSVTLKAGFVNFRLSPSLLSNLLPSAAIVSNILGLRTSNLNAAIFPAGGLEAVLGPIGLRFEFG